MVNPMFGDIMAGVTGGYQRIHSRQVKTSLPQRITYACAIAGTTNQADPAGKTDDENDLHALCFLLVRLFLLGVSLVRTARKFVALPNPETNLFIANTYFGNALKGVRKADIKRHVSNSQVRISCCLAKIKITVRRTIQVGVGCFPCVRHRG